jgi:hypothetical protein
MTWSNLIAHSENAHGCGGRERECTRERARKRRERERERKREREKEKRDIYRQHQAHRHIDAI